VHATADTMDWQARECAGRRAAQAAVGAAALLSFLYCYVYAALSGGKAELVASLYWTVADWGVWLLLAPLAVHDALRSHAAGHTRRHALLHVVPRLLIYVAAALAVRAVFSLVHGGEDTAFLLYKRLPLFLACALVAAACGFWQVRPRLVVMAPAPPAQKPAPACAVLVVQSAHGEHRLPLSEVGYIEACGNYLEVRAGAGTYLMRQTMKALEEQLAGSQLVRCHRSYFVNLAHVDKFEFRATGNHVVYLRDGASIPVSKAYRDTVRGAMSASPA
jgi:DNA-binding LytR/AlgR family response regulator